MHGALSSMSVPSFMANNVEQTDRTRLFRTSSHQASLVAQLYGESTDSRYTAHRVVSVQCVCVCRAVPSAACLRLPCTCLSHAEQQSGDSAVTVELVFRAFKSSLALSRLGFETDRVRGRSDDHMNILSHEIIQKHTVTLARGIFQDFFSVCFFSVFPSNQCNNVTAIACVVLLCTLYRKVPVAVSQLHK